MSVVRNQEKPETSGGGISVPFWKNLPFSVNRLRFILGISGLVLMACLLGAPVSVQAADTPDHRSPFSVLLGYGSSYPGWGSTRIRVETVETILRYELPKTATIGSSWYSGYHSLMVEVPVDFLRDRSGPPMIGCSFLAAYTFSQGERLHPYLVAGGGPLYVPADIPGMGSHLNGHYLGGIGVSYPLAGDHALLIELRYHHVSNGGMREPNDPLNSFKFLLGFTF